MVDKFMSTTDAKYETIGKFERIDGSLSVEKTDMGDFGCFILSTGSSTFPEIKGEGIMPDSLIVEGNAVSLVDDDIPLATAKYLATLPRFKTGCHLVISMEGGVCKEDLERIVEVLPSWNLTLEDEFTSDDENYRTMVGDVIEADYCKFYVVKATKKDMEPITDDQIDVLRTKLEALKTMCTASNPDVASVIASIEKLVTSMKELSSRLNTYPEILSLEATLLLLQSV